MSLDLSSVDPACFFSEEAIKAAARRLWENKNGRRPWASASYDSQLKYHDEAHSILIAGLSTEVLARAAATKGDAT